MAKNDSKIPQAARAQSVHHGNIRNKESAESRLRAAFRKTKVFLSTGKDKERITATVILTEIHPRSTYLFVEEQLRKGTLITVHLTDPLAIDVKGKVRYCEEVNIAKRIRRKKGGSQYRLLVEFSLLSEVEKGAMEDYYQQVRDESFVATRWHHYVTQRAQAEAKSKAQQQKMQEAVKDAQDEPVLATEDVLTEEAKGEATLSAKESVEKNSETTSTASAAEKTKTDSKDENAA